MFPAVQLDRIWLDLVQDVIKQVFALTLYNTIGLVNDISLDDCT